jgi:hypothetical protein
MEVSGQYHAPAALPPGKEPHSTHWIGGWVGPRISLDDVEKRKMLHCREWNLISSAVHSVAHRYIDWAAPGPLKWCENPNYEAPLKACDDGILIQLVTASVV